MAKVILLVWFLMPFVIKDFYFGDSLQHITDSDLQAILKNFLIKWSSFLINEIETPSITKILFFNNPNSSNFRLISFNLFLFYFSLNSSFSITNNYSSSFFIPALIAIQEAVSILSPVSIHTWIPACFIFSTVGLISH